MHRLPLDAVAAQLGSTVIGHSIYRAERREISKGHEMAQPQRPQEITRQADTSR